MDTLLSRAESVFRFVLQVRISYFINNRDSKTRYFIERTPSQSSQIKVMKLEAEKWLFDGNYTPVVEYWKWQYFKKEPTLWYMDTVKAQNRLHNLTMLLPYNI